MPQDPLPPSSLPKVLSGSIGAYPDFPIPGIMYRDVHPLMTQPRARSMVVAALVEQFGDAKLDAVMGIESRGYYFALPLADALNVAFLPIRKAGKLPGELITETYDTEYSKGVRIELQKNVLRPGARVLIIDDLLATGGTALGACRIAESAGCVVVAFWALMWIRAIGGDRSIPKHIPFHHVIAYE